MNLAQFVLQSNYMQEHISGCFELELGNTAVYMTTVATENQTSQIKIVSESTIQSCAVPSWIIFNILPDVMRPHHS